MNYENTYTTMVYLIIGTFSTTQSQVSTTVPTVPSTASARPGWTVQWNWQTINGVPQSGVTTLTDCQQRCENITTCTGLDWDRNNLEQNFCWFNGTGGQSASGIDHWTHTGTSGSTSSIAGATSTSVSTSASSNQLCDNTTWIETVEFSYAHSIGQTIYAMNNSRCCLYLCEATPSCQGFDWYSNDSTCALWNTSSDNPTQEADSSIHHYFAIKNLTYCNAYAIDLINWQAMANIHANDGVNQPGITQLVDCLSGCQNDPRCRGFDWDEFNADKNNCWFHLDTYPSPAIAGPGIILFIKQDSRSLISPAPKASLEYDCSVYLPTTTTTKTTTTTIQGSSTAASISTLSATSPPDLGTKTGTIVGSTIGAVALLAVVFAVVIFMIK